MPDRVPFRLLAAVLRLVLPVVVVSFAGCAFDPPPEPLPPIDPIPINDSPRNALRRFEGVYQRKILVDYEPLFASNFRFTFSSQSDPGLAALYGTSWNKDDEIESTRHLFDGFVDGDGVFQGPAEAIALSLEGYSIIPDPRKPDSAAWYQVAIVPSVQLRLTILGGTEVSISAPHDFYLVRGDAAVLDAAQEARDDRWYVWRWDDRSAALPGAGTWGALRSTYAADPEPNR